MPRNHEFTRVGYAIVPHVLGESQIENLRSALHLAGEEKTSRRAGVYALRDLLAIPEVRKLASAPSIRALVEPILGPKAVAVRGLFFDKTADANWKVVWHQDLTIAVKAKIETQGFGPWSVKAGIVHVQPPREILEKMLAVRLHLDDCHEKNGALRVLPGSQNAGKLGAESIEMWRQCSSETVCEVPLGGALLMRPLILHASSPAYEPTHRRVIHLEFAAAKLPEPLEWHESV